MPTSVEVDNEVAIVELLPAGERGRYPTAVFLAPVEVEGHLVSVPDLSLTTDVVRSYVRHIHAAHTTVQEATGPLIRRTRPSTETAVINALRIRGVRQGLIDSGVYTVGDLVEGRLSNSNAVHQWLRRAVAARRVFTISNGNELLIPAILLDDVLDPVPGWQAVIEELARAGETSWGMWMWIATPTGWLDDEMPADLIIDSPDLVRDAAHRKYLASAANDQ